MSHEISARGKQQDVHYGTGNKCVRKYRRRACDPAEICASGAAVVCDGELGTGWRNCSSCWNVPDVMAVTCTHMSVDQVLPVGGPLIQLAAAVVGLTLTVCACGRGRVNSDSRCI